MGLVKATYKSLVKVFHPDIFQGDKQFAIDRITDLNAAYDFLSDPQKKEISMKVYLLKTVRAAAKSITQMTEMKSFHAHQII